ncbi:hypothetical protein [Methylobacterium brachythecii]|uniref:Uncharacterized protein n=1 Tax=Methylobacterium brachythecii TaxID=1176177 RepID=A0A7W6F943_9HYPH|nr:hypothetical protein [Methylobacterium brachythecii]MBB3905104.1 hypothetical protein [Methylobacterium brachythecii]GLS44388.1 hypothetical protein GCM10007884_23760 [Methylobacterium brachythecii]
MNAQRPIVPVYPPRYTVRAVTAWAIALLNAYKPALPASPIMAAKREPEADVAFRTLLQTCVADSIHRRQLGAWCTAKANPADRDLSFAQACKRHGWSEKTAERNVDRSLTALVLALNNDGAGAQSLNREHN